MAESVDANSVQILLNSGPLSEKLVCVQYGEITEHRYTLVNETFPKCFRNVSVSVLDLVSKMPYLGN